MGRQPQARKRHAVNRHKERLLKAKNFRKKNAKDLDEIHDTLDKLNDEKPQKLEINEDLPGLGQFLCFECSRYFIDEKTLQEHKRSKLHKKRIRNLKDTPYSQAEAEAAAGLGNYTYKRKKEEHDLVIGKRLKI